ncbi:MAG TPA: CehA/McbA family metallohydrolase [Planctomycetota bacterium]
MSDRVATILLLAFVAAPLAAQDLAPVRAVEAQPLKAHVARLAEALEFAGQPLSAAEKARLDAARKDLDPERAALEIQAVLAPHVLLAVEINPESRVKVGRGQAAAELVQDGWRSFLVRVHNMAGVTASLRASSPQAAPVYRGSTGASEPAVSVEDWQVQERWMDLSLYTRPPLQDRLSGGELEYAVVQIYSRDAGGRDGTFLVDIGQGTQDLGFRNQASVLFRCLPSLPVTLEVFDFDGSPTTAGFEIRDATGRVYPTPAKRLAPDFFFHPQIYRENGESVQLAPGRYQVVFGRGPEYLRKRQELVVHADDGPQSASFQLERWIHPAAEGWYSGDHHVHGGGCAHYESPTAGVRPEDMFRHQLGEDLNVACVLSWGPCWYFQKQFFEGTVHALSTADNLMRYDVEVSGFPSQHAGHLCLLRLEEDDYPETERIEDWPSWDLPILQWGKAQGGVVGFSHSGWGLEVGTDQLPNYEMPPFNGIGANEYVVDVTHDAVDFLSTVDTPHVWELNVWYHTLNCGYRTRISGETDFPCIYGERVGLGRIYTQLPGGLDFDAFCDALRDGRSYVGDGQSHLLDFTLEGGGARAALGVDGSEMRLAAAGKVTARVRAAARLDEDPQAFAWLRESAYWQKPYWHVERARIGATRTVPVEVVVNGQAVARQVLPADGAIHELAFEVPIERSSWVALRILPSSHTNPVWVVVDEQPVRASRRSAQWLLDAVEVCWNSKRGNTRPAERAAMREAYDHAAASYRRILAESKVD